MKKRYMKNCTTNEVINSKNKDNATNINNTKNVISKKTDNFDYKSKKYIRNDKKDSVSNSECIEKKKNKRFYIAGISIWKIIAYFLIYSFIGYVIETIFGAMTKGVIESRRSVLYGPFCEIYGLGAVVMIIGLQPFKKNNLRLFIAGFCIGTAVEYCISLIGELIFNVKWWDYSNYPLNVNGRVCVFFSLFWGFLAIFLITYVNIKIDKIINWIKNKFSKRKLKIFIFVFAIVMIYNNVATAIALDMFITRKVHDNNLCVANKSYIEKKYDYVYSNEWMKNFIYSRWNDKKMIRTFPNLKIEDVYGNIIYFDQYVGDIQPYYYKFYHQNTINFFNIRNTIGDFVSNISK